MAAKIDGGHIRKVVGVKDASGQCICSTQLGQIVFPAKKVEELESDFYNLTDVLQNQLNTIYNFQTTVSTATNNLTTLEKRLNYTKTFGTHIDLDFNRLIFDIHAVISLAKNISKSATTESSKKQINTLIKEIDSINTVVTKMGKYDKKNIITAQREISLLRKKLEECEEAIMSGGPLSPPVPPAQPTVGKCDHGGLLRVSAPVLVKLNWRGPDFKAGAWGKDFAVGTKVPDYYWVFPINKDERTLEIARLYASMKKLTLYSPLQQYSLNIKGNAKEGKCLDCGQGAGVIFFNGSFYYNCFDSRAVCKADPITTKVVRSEFEDKDPTSFNNWLSYKGIKYQDMDLAGDEQGMWLIHGSVVANGNVVIRKMDPKTLKVGSPWITTQPKEKMSNSFMICGRLYATKTLNDTHEEIYYVYDTKTSSEKNIKIIMEKPLPTVQSLKYNPNDQKLYLYNDGYLVYYNVTFKSHLPGRRGEVDGTVQLHNSETEQSLANDGWWTSPGQESPSSDSKEQQDLAGQGGPNDNQNEQPMTVALVRRDTMREGGHFLVRS
ncbi:olfactomedin-like [Tiliqua scincoides]|uniref:olfactomedin-like n=1 Tax=Tiliqua scincoides TaxID=71010 RepID=UPI0034625AA4